MGWRGADFGLSRRFDASLKTRQTTGIGLLSLNSGDTVRHERSGWPYHHRS